MDGWRAFDVGEEHVSGDSGHSCCRDLQQDTNFSRNTMEEKVSLRNVYVIKVNAFK